MTAASYIHECVSAYIHTKTHMYTHAYMYMCMTRLLPSAYSEHSYVQMWDMGSVFPA